MKNEKKYYNAKPSKIGNIGKDVSGAKRMYFDTYESEQEKQVAKRKRKGLKEVKEQLKAEVLSESPNAQRIIELLGKRVELEHGVNPTREDASFQISLLRDAVDTKDREQVSTFNNLIRAYRKVERDIFRLSSNYPEYTINRLKRAYKPKKKPFVEENGKTVDWSSFEDTTKLTKDFDFLSEHTQAVQFGNSVSDRERSYILIELTRFLKDWSNDSIFRHVNLKPLHWSFGARGKAGSVAYYNPNQVLISVNRNNIGSLIHEIGHYIDFTQGMPSSKISAQTIREYRDMVKEQNPYLSHTEMRYYCSRVEIFARAFEAYCFKVKAGFSEFAQCGKSYLPVLNDELLDIIGECFRPWAMNSASNSHSEPVQQSLAANKGSQ